MDTKAVTQNKASCPTQNSTLFSMCTFPRYLTQHLCTQISQAAKFLIKITATSPLLTPNLANVRGEGVCHQILGPIGTQPLTAHKDARSLTLVKASTEPGPWEELGFQFTHSSPASPSNLSQAGAIKTHHTLGCFPSNK